MIMSAMRKRYRVADNLLKTCRQLEKAVDYFGSIAKIAKQFFKVAHR